MVRKCCACFKGCGTGEKITLHKFPKDLFVRRRWMIAIGRKNFVPSNTSVLCSRHFNPECFTYGKSGKQKRIFIKPNAVPTLFPPITQSRRSIMRSNLPRLTNTARSDIGFLLSQSSGPGEYAKSGIRTFNDVNASEAGMSMESVENAVDILYLKERGSSIDWVEDFDHNTDSPISHIKEQSNSMEWSERCKKINNYVVQYKRKMNPASCNEEQKIDNDSDEIYDFKSKRRTLKNLNLALSCIAAQRKEIKIVKQKNRLLEKRLSILKALLTHVLSEKILSEHDRETDSDSESEIWSG